jgi:hypothetical protein
VNRKVALAQAGMDEVVLPARVQEALGQLVGAAEEGLLALSVGVGLGVLAELMEDEVAEVVGPRGKHDPGRAAVRHGHESGEVTLGGRRVQVERPRVRSADGLAELPLRTYAHFADRDPLTKAVLERMLAGVSTRRYGRTQEPVGSEVEQQARSTSRSAVSRTFVERTRRSLGELMSRRLDDVRLAAMMIDGLELQGRINVVCLGITTEGVKIPLGPCADPACVQRNRARPCGRYPYGSSLRAGSSRRDTPRPIRDRRRRRAGTDAALLPLGSSAGVGYPRLTHSLRLDLNGWT